MIAESNIFCHIIILIFKPKFAIIISNTYSTDDGYFGITSLFTYSYTFIYKFCTISFNDDTNIYNKSIFYHTESQYLVSDSIINLLKQYLHVIFSLCRHFTITSS